VQLRNRIRTRNDPRERVAGTQYSLTSLIQFTYIVFNIYCTVCANPTNLVCTTNFLPGSADTSWPPPSNPAVPSLPPWMINVYTSTKDLLNQLLPTTIHNTLNLAYLAIAHTLTPSILTSLLYRIFVLYAATRIIPAVRGVSQDLTWSSSTPRSTEPVPHPLTLLTCSPPN
jgi:ICE2